MFEPVNWVYQPKHSLITDNFSIGFLFETLIHTVVFHCCYNFCDFLWVFMAIPINCYFILKVIVYINIFNRLLVLAMYQTNSSEKAAIIKYG